MLADTTELESLGGSTENVNKLELETIKRGGGENLALRGNSSP